MDVRPIDGSFALEVTGVQLWNGLQPDELRRVREAWIDSGVLVFRRQSLSEGELVAVTRLFGEPHVVHRTDWISPEHPEVILISNLKDQAGKQIGMPGSNDLEWHTDQSYVADPASGAMLYAVEIPNDGGGQTWWTNMRRGYDELPAELRALCDDRRAILSYLKRLADYNEQASAVTQDMLRKTPPVAQPVVGFCLYGFINWLPTFLVKQGVSIASSLLWLTVMGLGAPAGALLGLLMSDRIGRKPVIVGASCWAAAWGTLFAMQATGGNGIGLMVIGFLLFLGIYVILAVGFALHVPELFRTEYRLRGTAVCSTAGRIATACVQYVVIWLFALGGLAGVVSLLVGLLLVQALAFAVFGIETAGRSLESIDEAEGGPQVAGPSSPSPASSSPAGPVRASLQ